MERGAEDMRAIVVLLAVGALSACVTGPAGPGEALELSLPTESLSLNQAFDVTVTNRTGGDLYLAHCNHLVALALEERRGGSWNPTEGLGTMCTANLPMGEIRLGAGLAISRSLAIGRAGEFRLVAYARRAADDFGSDVGRSSPFIVRD
jgi:hypothetical protein